jgi:uncharacterized protein YcnI
MRLTTRASSRALIAAAAVSAGLLACAAPASAHVHADADDPTPGSYSVVTLRVPNESEKGSLTTQLSVNLPAVASASTEAMPGWSARLQRDTAAGTVSSVTWTAAPGAGIAPDQFAMFRISVKLPNAASISLPAIQTYSDGTVVKWDQPTPPGGAEPEYPAPEIALTGAKAGSNPTPAPDNTARWLAGGALGLAAVAVATALLVRRRA